MAKTRKYTKYRKYKRRSTKKRRYMRKRSRKNKKSGGGSSITDKVKKMGKSVTNFSLDKATQFLKNQGYVEVEQEDTTGYKCKAYVKCEWPKVIEGIPMEYVPIADVPMEDVLMGEKVDI